MKNRLLLNLKTLQITEKQNKYRAIIKEIDQLRLEKEEIETQGSVYDVYD